MGATWISLATLLVMTMSSCSASVVELTNNDYSNTTSQLHFNDGASMMQHDEDMEFLMDSPISSSLATTFKTFIKSTGDRKRQVVDCGRRKPYISCLPNPNRPSKIQEHCGCVYKENRNRLCK
ncbi:hypothetical protein Patl1_21688 [Pistacia atlantica]|uniref:Uncharacterized protein n=1 Tax=Pistacia atlantica TaxID=434234 RepID=A0ACC1BL16_9ROSI|nr:hypothetical protein Patl1_21688 [Pistacia atlantica]